MLRYLFPQHYPFYVIFIFSFSYFINNYFTSPAMRASGLFHRCSMWQMFDSWPTLSDTTWCKRSNCFLHTWRAVVGPNHNSFELLGSTYTPKNSGAHELMHTTSSSLLAKMRLVVSPIKFYNFEQIQRDACRSNLLDAAGIWSFR